MCDTMVALGSATSDGHVLFAKNSDRQPNEPHIMVRIPRQYHKHGEKVKCTYIEVDQSEVTYEVLLLKPSWIWGCEMGSNEFGLNIGNEAVFTLEKYGEPALTGMDMLRLALERCRNSEEALDMIISLLEDYGQGGNCGYEKKFTYHNSFLIADANSAWVLETAGEYWAAEMVKDVRSISNCLSIGRSFDRAHPCLIEHAIEKKWCKSEQDFDFARCYSDSIFTYFSGAKTRRTYSQSCLEKNRGSIDVNIMKSILRSHHPSIEGAQFRRSSLKSICMHGGGIIGGDHTTGSYIASLGNDECTYWVTGSSTPCLAVFKPLWLLNAEDITFKEEDFEAACEFWEKRERFHRMVLHNQIVDLSTYIQERDYLEEEWIRLTEDMEKGNDNESRKIMDTAWAQEEELLSRVMEGNKSNPSQLHGSPYFRCYWHRQDAKNRKRNK